jgi:5-methylcytosine-specific restriction enzyme subunit McrC
MSESQRSVSLAEHSSTRVELEHDDERYIQEITDQHADDQTQPPLSVTPTTQRRNMYHLQSYGHVGVVQLPSGIRIQIDPKIEQTQLLRMLNYVKTDNPLPHLADKITLEGGDEFLDIIGYIFAEELEMVLTRGVEKGYVSERDVTTHIRGKLDISRQLQTPRENQFHVEYETLTRDTQINQLILYATDILRKMVIGSDLSRRLNTLHTRFKRDVTSVRFHPDQLDTIILDSTNGYYQTAVELSKQIVRSIYYDGLNPGEVTAFGFLINMNELFEEFVTNLLSDAYPEKTIVKEHNSLFEPHEGLIKPDLVIRDGTQLHLVGDVKYKQYESNSRGAPNNDYYQVIAYSDVYGSDAFLIYPGEDPVETKTVKNSSKQISLVPLEVSALSNEEFISDAQTTLQDKLLRIVG